jgi:Protein of unknown function (DUF1579)
VKRTNQTASFLALLLACYLSVTVVAPIARAKDAALAKPADSMTPLLKLMVGTWDVQQRMWPGPDAQAINLPPAVAHRRLVGGAYLQEIMGPAHHSKRHSFTRTAYINFNPVSKRYEYFSIDTRAPQQMYYQSTPRTDSGMKPVKLRGAVFVAPQWGKYENVAFSYRLVLGEVKDNQQIVRLYLTPQSGRDRQEFLAFEYVYTRHR